jgi:thioredoxin-like negative regulator of GroEL
VIERLLIAIGLLAVATLAGHGVRAFGAARSRRLASKARVDPASDGAARLMVFSSRWCSDCAVQHKVIERSRESWPRPVEISYHDAVADRELADRFGILLVPAIVVADAAGRVVEVKQGLVDEDRLRSILTMAA